MKLLKVEVKHFFAHVINELALVKDMYVRLIYICSTSNVVHTRQEKLVYVVAV